jgi:hypothetical protein
MKNNMKPYLLATLIMLILLQACFKEDERASPFPGEVTTIDSVQVYQSYFNFDSGRVVKTHPVNAWQLGFECGTNGWHIITNSGANWFIFNTGQNLPDDMYTMPNSLTGMFDMPHAWPDSTAVGSWVTFTAGENEYTRNIYLLGKYVNGAFTNLKQLAFLEVTDTSYTFYYKEQKTGISDTVSVLKNDRVNFEYYSFDLHEQVNLEPDKTSYDLVFGSYYDLATLFEQTIPYHVGGVLLNAWETVVAIDSTDEYTAVGFETIPGLDFTQQRDIPGYRWKTVTIDITGGGAATYAVRTDYTYIFRTAQGNFFKLRFLSYTLEGRSGFPRFEYSQLK